MKDALSRVSFGQWLGAVIAILAIIFVFTNTQSWRISFYGLHLSGPAWLVLLIILFVGWLVGTLMARKRYKKQ